MNLQKYKGMAGEVTLVVVIVMVAGLTSCSRSQVGGSKVCETKAAMSEPSSEMASTIPGASSDAESDQPKVDLEAFYKSILRKHGNVEDFSNANLIKLMDRENPSLRAFSALLLAYRNERSAIPRLVEALVEASDDEFPIVQIKVAEALLKMGNTEGVPVLLGLCEKASQEYEQGDYRNTHSMLSATEVLADAGEVSAVPYLRMLITDERSWSLRLIAIRALSKLYEKQPSLLRDIASRLEDENPQIRREVTEILQRIETKRSATSQQDNREK